MSACSIDGQNEVGVDVMSRQEYLAESNKRQRGESRFREDDDAADQAGDDAASEASTVLRASRGDVGNRPQTDRTIATVFDISDLSVQYDPTLCKFVFDKPDAVSPSLKSMLSNAIVGVVAAPNHQGLLQSTVASCVPELMNFESTSLLRLEAREQAMRRIVLLQQRHGMQTPASP
jgi:hypothetical protein